MITTVSGVNFTYALFLTQSGQTITGMFISGNIRGTLVGSVSGTDIAFTITDTTVEPGYTANFTGTIVSDSEISGSVNDVHGETGSWTAYR